MLKPRRKSEITHLVRASVESFAIGFRARHEGEVHNPNGTINMKIHNVFIAALGEELQYYTALVRSLDSSLGNMLEALAISIAMLFFDVRRKVEGPISQSQTEAIATLLERYKAHSLKPSVGDYSFLRDDDAEEHLARRRHQSDYYLRDRETGDHFLIELKIGGDLDTKKARSEKEAMLEQYAILSNTLPSGDSLRLFFGTAYNRFGEGKPWQQARVRQYFADEELLIGRDFWNFICRDEEGYDTVLDAYRESAPLINDALDTIKSLYIQPQ